MEIFGTDSTIERNFIARAQCLATAERYNAPQVCTFPRGFWTPVLTSVPVPLPSPSVYNKLPERMPTRIDIKVATEIEEGDVGIHTTHSSVVIEEEKVARL